MKTTILLLILTSTSAMASPMPGENRHTKGPELFENMHVAVTRNMVAYIPGPNCWEHTTKCESLWYANGDVSGDYGIVDAAD